MKSDVTSKDAFRKLSKISPEAQKRVTRLGSPMTIKKRHKEDIYPK